MLININDLTPLDIPTLYKIKAKVKTEIQVRAEKERKRTKEERKELQNKKDIDILEKEDNIERKRQISKRHKLPLPLPLDGHYCRCLSYLPYLLSQDWTHLHKYDWLDEEKKYYVYAHTDPLKQNTHISQRLIVPGIPFYIGKGTGNRAWDLKRNQGHGKKIKEVSLYVPEKDIVFIIKDNLTEEQALILESKLIYFFGTIYGLRKKGVLYNLNEERTPVFSKHKYITKKKKQNRNKKTIIGELKWKT